MGVTKTELFTESQNEIALAGKVFGNPARVAIIQYLVKANACVNGDLVKELGLSQATISQHLRELKEFGLIKGTIEGPRVSYCIHSEQWEKVKVQFTDLFNSYQNPDSEDCC